MTQRSTSLEEAREFLPNDRALFFEVASKYCRAGDKVLDVGAGGTRFAKGIKDAEVYLLDGNPETVEALKKDYPHSYCCTVPEPFPFEAETFNLIHCSHLVEHLQPRDVYSLMKEMDRCLSPGGFLAIGAPLLWSQFYDDLSHVRPYSPNVFVKYLCGSCEGTSLTRPPVSLAYKAVELVYRYSLEPMSGWNIAPPQKAAKKLLFKLIRWLRSSQFPGYEISGYILVLQKNEPLSADR